MKIRDYKIQGKPVVDIKDYYRDDYEMLQDICSCRWSEVLIVGLRRFGKTSLLKRIEGFVNQRDDYREFLNKGLVGWDRERDGNPPRKEFFDQLNTLEARALYLSFLDSFDCLEDQTMTFFKELNHGISLEKLNLEKIEPSLPPRLFILMDEFAKLAELDEEAGKKREFFLTFHRAVQNLNKEVVFVIAEPPSIFSTFEMSTKQDSSIAEVTDALQNRKIFSLNGLSTHEKLNLFCLKKTKNFGQDVDDRKIRDVLDRLSGIPLEIQIAGESFFSHPEKETKDILKDVADAFGGNLKSIIPTMNLQQQVFIRMVAEYELENEGLPWERIKKASHKLFEDLRNFGIIKKNNAALVRFTSEPIRSILCSEMTTLSSIVNDEIYQRELKTMIVSDEEKQLGLSPDFEPWDGKIRIHHLSDMTLGHFIKGFICTDSMHRTDLFALNNNTNPFYAYFKLLKSHSRYIPHILIITGDIALTDHGPNYRGFKEFINEILALIRPLPRERAVLPKKQIILVPGEMDISNPMDMDCYDTNGLDTLDSCNFGDFFRAFNNYGIPPENASQNGPDKMISITLPATQGISGYNLEILPFNSATMIWPKENINQRRLEYLDKLRKTIAHDDEKSIKVGLKEFVGDEIGFLNMDGLERGACKLDNNDDSLRIAVTHHNINPQEVRNENYTVDMVNAPEAKAILLQNRFSVLLHGHQRAPIFIKETLYRKEPNSQKEQKEKKGLKTLFMNGAGKFTDTKFQVDDDSFGPSFNSYEIRRIENRDGDMGKYRGDFKIHSTVFTYNPDENEFKPDQQIVKEEIFIDED